MAVGMPTTEAYYKNVPNDVLDAIAQIYIDSFTGPPRFETWTFEQAKAHIQKFVDCGADLVVIKGDDGTIESFGISLPLKDYFNKDELIAHGATESAYYFAELATKPSARNKGYGSLLHQKRLAIAKERGFHKLNVRAREDNKVIIKMLTKKLGFKQISQYVSTIKNSQSVRLILELDI